MEVGSAGGAQAAAVTAASCITCLHRRCAVQGGGWSSVGGLGGRISHSGPQKRQRNKHQAQQQPGWQSVPP